MARMTKYKDVNNDSGVEKYTKGKASIRVQFEDKSQYTYTAKSAGAVKVEIMKTLADVGDGLNAFINNYAYDDYSRKKKP